MQMVITKINIPQGHRISPPLRMNCLVAARGGTSENRSYREVAQQELITLGQTVPSDVILESVISSVQEKRGR